MTTPSKADYKRIFDKEAANQYPKMRDFEREMGFGLDARKYLPAAWLLACPWKVNPPNWQHGRVIYAATRRRLQRGDMEPGTYLLVDIGTAKGYSALCLRWAAWQTSIYVPGISTIVASYDVIPPLARVARNSVLDLGGLSTVQEMLAPWPEAAPIQFREAPVDPDEWPGMRVPVAFIDGKHTSEAVTRDIEAIEPRQEEGDIMIFDDLQIAGVALGIKALGKKYKVRRINLGSTPPRTYAIATRV